MNRLFAGILSCALVFCLMGCSQKQSQVLEKRGRVNDLAGVLTEETELSLTSDLAQYERETCHQLFVLVVDSLKGETIQEMSNRTALQWEIGYPALNNGILLSVAIDEGQARIEVGSALETIIEQGAAERILKSEMFPLFKAGKIDKGIIEGVEAIMMEARKLRIPDELRPPVCR
jgi:uncharacterized protein